MSNKFFNDDKGELTTTQIVTIIILLISFAVVLFLIFRLNPADTNDSAICYNSVVMAGNAVPGLNNGLQCKTQYVCLTKNGNCEGLNSPVVIKVENKDEIYHALANQMVSCWNMFGQGKINYVSNQLTKENFCSICSHVLLDNSLQNINGLSGGIVNKDELYSYMANNKYKDSKSYLEYIFKTNDLNGLKAAAFEKINAGTNLGFGQMEIGKTYFVVMGITNEVSGTGWTAAGAGAGAVFGGIVTGIIAIASGPPGWVVGAVIVGSGLVAGGAVGGVGSDYYQAQTAEIGALTVQGNGIDNIFMAPTIVEANSDKFKALKCEEILTLG